MPGAAEVFDGTPRRAVPVAVPPTDTELSTVVVAVVPIGHRGEARKEIGHPAVP